MPTGKFSVGGFVMIDGCIHHWLIEPANGPISNGTCKTCKEQKSFTNTEPYRTGSWSKIVTDQRKRTDLDS